MSDDARGKRTFFEQFVPVAAGVFKNLEPTRLARRHQLADDRSYGHWCKRCEGIWFGHALEAECPVCGNRQG